MSNKVKGLVCSNKETGGEVSTKIALSITSLLSTGPSVVGIENSPDEIGLNSTGLKDKVDSGEKGLKEGPAPIAGANPTVDDDKEAAAPSTVEIDISSSLD